jgi:hypothetical protein
MRFHSRLLATLAAATLLLSAPAAWAQASALATADATAFIGSWALGLDTPQGAMTMQLQVKDEGGKVAATIAADPIMPTPQPITDITKKGDTLVLAYTLDVQGQSIPATIVLAPDGDKWKATFDFMQGQFTVDGTAAKK